MGDDLSNVMKNREKILKNTEGNKIIFLRQVHGKRCILATFDNADNLYEADGCYTSERNLVLAIATADCQAAVFYDPVTKMIGAAHAGWKGLMQNIYQEMVNIFIRHGAKSENILVAIGPSLRMDHAEFKDYQSHILEKYWNYREGNFFDLPRIGKDQLLEAKLLEQNIEISPYCTFCEEKKFFSYRRNQKTGRFATVIMKR